MDVGRRRPSRGRGLAFAMLTRLQCLAYFTKLTLCHPSCLLFFCACFFGLLCACVWPAGSSMSSMLVILTRLFPLAGGLLSVRCSWGGTSSSSGLARLA